MFRAVACLPPFEDGTVLVVFKTKVFVVPFLKRFGILAFEKETAEAMDTRFNVFLVLLDNYRVACYKRAGKQ